MFVSPRPVPASDYFVGQTCTYHQLVDDKLVRGYADLTGDHNKIHVDDAFAKKNEIRPAYRPWWNHVRYDFQGIRRRDARSWNGLS